MGLHFKENEEKITISLIITGIIIIGILFASLVAFLVSFRGKEKSVDFAKDQTEIGKIDNDEFKDVSMEIGKNIEEAKNETNSNSMQNNLNLQKSEKEADTVNTIQKENLDKLTDENSSSKKENISTTKKDTKQVTQNKEEKKEELKFITPIKGEILRDFSPDSLVYSNTLEEWVTHNGIDIKADKTSVVVASCDGKVSSITNDPRYGLTVIIEHKNGFQTIYRNLLTAEFVVEGEEVSQGQTIGTVGNTAAFEIADDDHLHFEMLENGEYVDPKNYIDL